MDELAAILVRRKGHDGASVTGSLLRMGDVSCAIRTPSRRKRHGARFLLHRGLSWFLMWPSSTFRNTWRS